jgi:flagellar biosynthetic protein FliO
VSLAGLSLIKVGDASADNALANLGTDRAETTQAGAQPVTTDTESGVYPAVGKMLSALGVVILVAYGALYVLRRMMGKRHGGNGVGSLEILQTTHVGPHKTISLVRVGQRSVLVGVTDQQISTLTELDEQETEEIVGAEVVAETKKDGFATLLSAAADKIKAVGSKRRPAVIET